MGFFRSSRARVLASRCLKALGILLAILLLGYVLWLLGCSIHLGNSGPASPVDSYDELKQELADLPGVVFPDISTFDEDTFTFEVLHPPPNGEPKVGYSFYAYTVSVERLEKSSADSMLSGLRFGCANIGLLAQEEASTPWAAVNTIYRGIPMEIHITDVTEEYVITQGDSSPYPRGTQVFYFSHKFSFDGYRYEIYADLMISPERISEVDIEEEKAAADAEIKGLIDSILDQKGVPR